MTEQAELQNPKITSLYVVTNTLAEYAAYVKELGAVVLHPSQKIYKLGRFTVHWLDVEKIRTQLEGVAPMYALVVLGPNWDKAEDRMPKMEEASLRGYCKTHRFKFTYGRELRNYEGVGL